jgi:hypothetical protein
MDQELNYSVAVVYCQSRFCATEARLFAFAEGVDIASVTQQRMKEVTNLRQGNFLARGISPRCHRERGFLLGPYASS